MSNQNSEHQGRFAIIPSYVRYDENLTANAKLLYGEITALCNKEGYCWAGNDYFSNLYKVSNRTVRNWLISLEENNYIKIRFNGTSKRRIYLTDDPNQKIDWGEEKDLKNWEKKETETTPENGGRKKTSEGRKKTSEGSENNFRGGNSPDMQGDRADEQKKSSNSTINNTRETVSSKEQKSQNKNDEKSEHSFGGLFKSKSLKVLREKHPNHPIPTKRIHTVKNLLDKGLPDNVTAFLIEYVCENSAGVFKPNYAETIGNHWLSENIKTVEEAKQQIKEFRNANSTNKGNSNFHKNREENQNQILRELYQEALEEEKGAK